MKIIFFSPNFFPLVGGLESVMLQWAYGLVNAGHKVQVITLTSSKEPDEFPFEVYRCIGQFQMWKLMRKSNVIIQFNVSLKGIFPCLLSFRPFFVSHHSTNFNLHGRFNKRGRWKQFIANNLVRKNIACSKYVASQMKNSVVVNNPYDSNVFRWKNFGYRQHELVFVGRLVSDKGGDLLLRTLSVLNKSRKEKLQLIVVGEGPERENLIALANEEGIKNQITFAGKKRGQELGDLLNQSRIMVVPSTWEEPFGIVALEGLACGCKVVVARAGGLMEAIGDFGFSFEKNNPENLALILEEIVRKEIRPSYRQADLDSFLANFTVETSVSQLLAVISS